MTTTSRVSETVSRNVRRLRVAHDWTQDEAGRRLGEITGTPWSKAVWSLAEKQTRPREWTASEIVGLSLLFSVPLDELFAPDKPTPTCPTCGQEVTR